MEKYQAAEVLPDNSLAVYPTTMLDEANPIIMTLIFEWHTEKAAANLRKHKVSFEEAKTVFDDPLSITISDPDHSIDEERYIDIGMSSKGRILIVTYTERAPNIRLISCRKATNPERRQYERGNF